MRTIERLIFPICLVLIGIGILLLAGWDNQRTMAAPAPEAWYQGSDAPNPVLFFGHAQCVDNPDKFFVIGSYPNMPYFYSYDASTNTWEAFDNYPIEIERSAVVCYGNKLYVAGGDTTSGATDLLSIYDIDTDTWFQGTNLPHPLKQAAAGVWNDHIYLVGGTQISLPWTPIDHVDIYDIATDTWTDQGGASMPVASSSPGYAQAGRYLYVVGGWSGDFNNNVNQTQRYDMATGEWQSGPEFISSRAAFALMATESHLYAIGGDADGGSQLNATDLVEALDISTWPLGEWVEITDPLPVASEGNAGFCSESVSGGEIWSIGGSDGVNPFPYTYYRPTESCFDFYFGDLTREEWELGNHPGGTAHYVIPLVNNGTISDTYDISVSSTWVYSASLSVGPIAPGVTDLVMVEIDVPEDAEPGDIDIATVTVTSQADPQATDSAQLTTSVTDWQEAADVLIDVAFHDRAQCANDPNGFYILGGSTPDLNYINEVYYYNAVDDSWTFKTYLPRGGGWGHIATCYDDKLYVIGSGFSQFMDVYDIASDTWAYALTVAPRSPYGAGIGVWDGELFMVGITDEVNIYNITENTWSYGPAMPAEPFGFGYIQAGQYLYVVGGFSGDWINWNDNLDITLRLDMADKEWENGPSFTSRRAIVNLGVSESYLYAIAGDVNGGDRLDPTGLVEVLDLSQWPEGEWADIEQPLPWALEANGGGFCTEARSGGEVWSVGGASGTWGKFITIDDVYYLSTGEPCVQNIVNLSDTPMQSEGEIGHTIEYTIDITNTGNITDYYNLEPVTTWPAGLVNGGPGPVAPGETIQVVLGVDVPPDVHVGDQGTTVVTVYSLRDPNIMDAIQITTTVVGNDIHLEPDALYQEGMYGETITYTLLVSNQGDITDTVSFTHTGNSWEVILPVASLELGIGESAEVNVNVIIPLDVWPGDMDDFELIATSAGNLFATDSATLTTTAFWYRVFLPLGIRN